MSDQMRIDYKFTYQFPGKPSPSNLEVQWLDLGEPTQRLILWNEDDGEILVETATVRMAKERNLTVTDRDWETGM